MRRVEEIYHDARELEPHQRPSYLDAACAGDAELRAEVNAFLDAADSLGGFLEPPSDGIFDRFDLALDPATPRIDGYRIDRELASGGMGVVYLAAQVNEHFERPVAIKVTRPDRANPDVARRFQFERRALAGLQHANIARLYESGTTTDGLPYLVMEYVDGLPIDEHCATHRLGVTSRIALIRDVAAAVHHAHKNLVVHRDLKPGNILVDRDGIPKLLDFGIAKDLSGDSASRPPLTAVGHRVMTPNYASPEQVRGETVTTASDVYSLGVILYEILTGRQPYRANSELPHALEQAICEEEPVAPSTAVARLDETTRAFYASVGTTPPRLRRRLSGDLDTILLKALRKEPERRYASADQFADDLQRFIDARPIRARRDTAAYRARKFLVRNRAASALAATALLTLVVSTITNARSARIARSERNAAVAAREMADHEAKVAQHVNRFISQILGGASPYRNGKDSRVRDVIDDAAERATRELGDSPEVETRVQTTLGHTYESLSMFSDAAKHLQRALDLTRNLPNASATDVARMKARVAYVVAESGDLDRSRSLFLEALDHFAAAHVRDNGVAQIYVRLARVHRMEHEWDEAESALEKGLEIYAEGPSGEEVTVEAHIGLASVLLQRRQVAQAESHTRLAIDLARRYGNDENRYLASGLTMLGCVLREQGDLEEAEKTLLQALAIQRSSRLSADPTLAEAIIPIGLSALSRKDPDAAIRWFREAVDLQRNALDADHPSIGATLNHLGTALRASGDLDGAREVLNEALDIHTQRFPAGHPRFAYIYNNLGVVEMTAGDLDAAEAWFRRALALRIRLYGADHPDVRFVADNLDRLANKLLQAEQFEAAIGVMESLLDLYRKVGSVDETSGWLYMLAYAHKQNSAANVAISLLDEALELLNDVEPRDDRKISIVHKLIEECRLDSEGGDDISR